MGKDNKEKQLKKSTEQVLLEIHEANKEDENDESKQETKTKVTRTSSLTELKDLTSEVAISNIPLTETDYLILEQHCLGTDDEFISEQYNVSIGYINKLLRNSNSATFLEKYSKTLQSKILTSNLGMIAKGINQQQKIINALFSEGKDAVALQKLFGNMSLVDVQEKLAKIYADEEPDSTASIQNLFVNLQQR